VFLQAVSKIHLTPNYGVAPYDGTPRIVVFIKGGSRASSKCSHTPMYAPLFHMLHMTPTASRALSLNVICIFEMA
jgi:hypothetical protein